ncbi:MAG: TonB-dependent receptor [Deltaproteobacteria bacterium]|nr:TonB-dependent receptor [Deltaproteobacteria bacterium]
MTRRPRHTPSELLRRSLVPVVFISISGLAAANPEAASEADEAVAELPSVVVTAEREKPKKEPVDSDVSRLEPTRAVTVLEPEWGAKAGSPGVADLMRGTLGVAVQQTGPGQGAPIVRGLVGSAVLVTVDGVRLNNAIFRPAPNQYYGLLDAYDVERIEILRGPGSALHGSDAMGGVVNVSTPLPRLEAATWQLRAGALALFQSADRSFTSRAHAMGGKRGVGASVGVTVQSHDDLRAGGGLKQVPTAYDSYAVDAKALVERGSHEGLVVAKYLQQPSTPRFDVLVPGHGQSEPEMDVFRFEPMARLSLLARYRLADPGRFARRMEVVGSFQRIWDDRVAREHGDVSEMSEDNRVNVGDLRLKLTSDLAGLAVTYGADASLDLVESARRSRNINTGDTKAEKARFADGSRVGAVAVHAETSLEKDRLAVQVGGRFGLHDVHVPAADRGAGTDLLSPNLSGGVGVSYLVHRAVRILSSVSRGFRVPNVHDLSTLGSRPGNRYQVPSPDLGSESVLGADLGVRLEGERVTAEMFGFASFYRDKIEAVPTGETTPEGRKIVRSENVSRMTLIGSELAVRARLLPGLELRGNATYTWGEERQASGETGPGERIPPLTGRAALDYQVTSRVRLGAGVALAARQDRLAARDLTDPRINPEGTPGWATIFASLQMVLHERVQARLAAENILDRRYREHASGMDAKGFNVVGSVALQL